ncbi:MAG: GNAT family N-acetyltransferase, partial [Actinomycetota bacterium]
MTSGSDSVTVRRASADDLPVIIDVCGTALQWSDLDTDQAFFRWKHLENPWGASPIWVAVDGEEGGPADPAPIVGVRTMMRWGLNDPSGAAHQAVRAVDTATLPSHQGRGIFSRTTMAAVESLTD